MQITLDRGIRVTIAFLDRYAAIVPQGYQAVVKITVGATSGFLFMIAAALFANVVGEQIAPPLASVFGYFGHTQTAWVSEHKKEWRRYSRGVQDNWIEAQKAHDTKDRDTAEYRKRFLDKMEKTDVRTPRTLLVFALLLPMAALRDLLGHRYRKRGIALLLVGLPMAIALNAAWAQKKEVFISNVLSANAESASPLSIPAGLVH
jgi:hypothetical protein